MRWHGKTLALVALGVACATAYHLGSPPSQSGNIDYGLQVAATSLQVGDVWERKAFGLTLPITNTTASAITIRDFVTSCTCSSVQPHSLTIAPGETAKAQVVIDLTPRNEADAALPSRDINVRIAPVLDGRAGRHPGWLISGKIKCALTSSRRLDLSEIHNSAIRIRAASLDVKAHLSLSVLKATCDPSVGTVLCKRGSTECSYCVELTPRPNMREGPINSSLVLQPVDADGNSIPAIEVALTGRVLGDIIATPSQLLLGARAIGEIAEEAILLRSHSGEYLSLQELAGESPDLSIQRLTKVPTGYEGFLVRQRVGQLGSRSQKLEFHFKTSGGMSERVTLPVSYYGLRAENLTAAK